MNSKYIMSGLIISLIGFSVASQAAEFAPASVRALGMGGSNIASTRGVDAAYWNPAAYGFFGEESSSMGNSGMADKSFGTDLDIGGALNVFGTLPGNLSILEKLTVPNTGNAGSGLSSGEILSVADFTNGFQQLDQAAGGLNVSPNGVLGARVSNYGVSIRTAGDYNLSVNFDTNQVGLGDDFVTALTGTPATVAPGTTLFFTPAQESALANDLVAAGMNTTDATNVAANYNNAITVESSQSGVSGTPAELSASLLDLYAAPGDIGANNTTLSVRSALLFEFGVTYGYAINDALSVGTTVKFMQATLSLGQGNVFGDSDVVGDLSNNSGSKTESDFGLDVGVMYRLPEWQAGLTIKNINTPTFVYDPSFTYELKPQVKIGGAWIPSETITVELGLDLTENEGAISSSKSQYWNIGVEWNAWDAVALRAGAFENIAQSDIGLVPTVGLGLNLWAVRLDGALAVSLNEVDLGGEKLPAYAAGSVAIAVDF